MRQLPGAILIVLSVVISVDTTGRYVERIINGRVKKCIPYFNCPPGNEILPCINEFTEEICAPCYDNSSTSEPEFVQPDYISSVDGDLSQLKCFRPLTLKNGKTASCTGNDVVYSQTLSNAHCINGQGCKCKLNDCYYGDACLCDVYTQRNRGQTCSAGHHLNNDGVCIPCPEGFEKKEAGCGPCLRLANYSIVTSKPVVTYKPVPVTEAPPEPSTEAPTSPKTTPVIVPVVTGTVRPSAEKPKEENNSTLIIVIVVVSLLVVFAVIFICVLYRKGKFKKMKTFCRGAWNQDDENRGVEELAHLDPQTEVIENEQNIQHQIRTQISMEKGDNNNVFRNNSCPSDREFNSGSTISVNRQLSMAAGEDRLDSDGSSRLNSESSPLIEKLHQEINRAISVNERDMCHMTDEFNRPKIKHSESVPESSNHHSGLRHSESAPQQVSSTDHGETCVSCGSPTSPGVRLAGSPTSPGVRIAYHALPYTENGIGSCFPLPDFSNIQTSSAVMNTELPNIAEFKRSISKDSESSVEHSSSPFSSIPEETGKEIQEDSVHQSHGSTVTVDPPHISDVADYNNCHLSHVTDEPNASDITNRIDSRLEQYNHTMTGLENSKSYNSSDRLTDNTATCSVNRLPSEHEEETAEKKDLESNLDSGMASRKSDLDSGMVSRKSDEDSVTLSSKS